MKRWGFTSLLVTLAACGPGSHWPSEHDVLYGCEPHSHHLLHVGYHCSGMDVTISKRHARRQAPAADIIKFTSNGSWGNSVGAFVPNAFGEGSWLLTAVLSNSDHQVELECKRFPGRDSLSLLPKDIWTCYALGVRVFAENASASAATATREKCQELGLFVAKNNDGISAAIAAGACLEHGFPTGFVDCVVHNAEPDPWDACYGKPFDISELASKMAEPVGPRR